MTLIDIGRKLSLINFSLLLFFGFSSHAQSSKDFAVYARVEVNRTTPSISIKWPKLTDVVNYQIYRKGKTESAWGTIKATVSGTDTMWTDTDIAIGIEYEYYIIKTKADLSNGFTYLLGGIDIPVVHSRGNVLVVVEKTLSDSLSTELNGYYKDLAADGWNVYSITVNKTDSIQTVRRAIQQKDAQFGGLKSLIILGHVPVPYSGNFAPDGHGDHAGVWPTDAYYAIDYNNWADAAYKVTGITRTENQNLPNDGKYDNSTLPGVVKYQTGRIDLSNMSKFSKSEIQLTKQYLKKDHDFRYKITRTVEKGIVDDNFSYTLGAFGSTGWRDFSVMFGANNVSSQDYFTACRNENILFAYGAGGGTYQSADGIGNTDSFTTQKGAIFNMLFGSYFGDWDNANNFLRAPLAAAENGLTSAWSGRPYWVNHAMALGEPIGYSVITTQNNKGTYQDNLYKNTVPIGLMGDPTLRLHIVAPPTNVKVTAINSKTVASLIWNTANETNIIGYNIYRSKTPFSNYTLINNTPISDTFYVDNFPYDSTNYYYVKTLKMTSSASGTYYNLSQGADSYISGMIDIARPTVVTKNISVYLNSAGIASISTTDVDNGSNCSCYIGSYSLSKSTFNCNNLGANTIYLTVSDTFGNSISKNAVVTILDTIKPTLLIKNPSITLVNGIVNISSNDVDNGSYDNCGISSFLVNPSNFDCDNIGINAITITITDNSGNISTKNATVTILGSKTALTLTKSELPEFCQGSNILLKSSVSEPVTYLWNTNQTSQNIFINSSGNYSLTTTNTFGCQSSANINLDYDITKLFSSYTILVGSEAAIDNNSIIGSGGVGSKGVSGKVGTSNNSLITASGTFAKAKTVTALTGSSITNAISGDSVLVTLPTFITNTKSSRSNDTRITRNTTVTLTDSIFNSLIIESGATLILTSPIIYANKITTFDNSTIKFSTCSKIFLSEGITLSTNNSINPDNLSVVFYCTKGVSIKKGTSFKGSIYSKADLSCNGAVDSRITMIGMFISKNQSSSYTDFNWNTNCQNCGTSNKRSSVFETKTNFDKASLHPNPTVNIANVVINLNEDGMTHIEVIDFTGKSIFTINKTCLKGENTIPLDLTKYPKGIYFVRLAYSDNVKTFKLLHIN